MANPRRRLVEVCSNADGFLGSYYEAKLLSRVGNGKFLVEYSTLVCEEDENEKLREVVDATELRPCPPEIRVDEFDVMEKVDAYDRDGWWVGRAIGKCGEDKYVVHFDSTMEEFVYPGHLLRVHQEWENGTWVPSHGRSHQEPRIIH